MKPITINISESDYKAFQEYASVNDRTAAEMIREAMAQYRTAHMEKTPGILSSMPASVGAVLAPLSADDDILGEMLHG